MTSTGNISSKEKKKNRKNVLAWRMHPRGGKVGNEQIQDRMSRAKCYEEK